jgi:hypothetical protein
MEYYICKKCGKTLHEENFGEVYDNETGMYIDFCPFCGNHDHFEDAERCECCGEIFPVKEMSGKLCESCLTEAANDKKARADYFESLDDSVQCDIVFADAEDFANFITDRSGRRYI